MRAFRLGYVEVASPGPEEQRQYLSEVLGMTQTEAGDGRSYHSLGLDHHNLAVVAGERPELRAIGLWVAADSKDVVADLKEAGLQAELCRDSRSGVSSLVSVEAPGGCRLHLFPEMSPAAPGFRKQGVAPLHLGHVAVASPDAPALISFLSDVLGFHVTDRIETLATFLTCTHEHHVLNVIGAPVPGTVLHHIAFGMRDSPHVTVATDQLASLGLPTVWGPSRHTAGHNFAAYHLDPTGNLIELYADMDVFVPELGYFEPRPWHGDVPQRPKIWPAAQLSGWQTLFGFDFASVLAI